MSHKFMVPMTTLYDLGPFGKVFVSVSDKYMHCILINIKTTSNGKLQLSGSSG